MTKCKFCEKEAGENRYCSNCEAPLCWSHVIRISLAVHEFDTCYEAPFYLCKECAKEYDFKKPLSNKYKKTEYFVYKELMELLK